MLWALGFHSIASTTTTNRHCWISDWQAQWKMNMEGKFVDLYKLPGAKDWWAGHNETSCLQNERCGFLSWVPK